MGNVNIMATGRDKKTKEQERQSAAFWALARPVPNRDNWRPIIGPRPRGKNNPLGTWTDEPLPATYKTYTKKPKGVKIWSAAERMLGPAVGNIEPPLLMAESEEGKQLAAAAQHIDYDSYGKEHGTGLDIVLQHQPKINIQSLERDKIPGETMQLADAKVVGRQSYIVNPKQVVTTNIDLNDTRQRVKACLRRARITPYTLHDNAFVIVRQRATSNLIRGLGSTDNKSDAVIQELVEENVAAVPGGEEVVNIDTQAVAKPEGLVALISRPQQAEQWGQWLVHSLGRQVVDKLSDMNNGAGKQALYELAERTGNNHCNTM